MVERRHHHVVETVKTLMHQASLPTTFWSFACHQAIFLINRMITPILKDKSPYEILFQESPSHENIKIFGYLCYPWLNHIQKVSLIYNHSPVFIWDFQIILLPSMV